ncbi:protein phosphatase 1B [Lingula anatina]|uniref:Protein phosphatase 1B n=1 Tax=Lingula anatina TaxID=7574 RepID=A0A1S3ICC3_LINAN|nr:protein phosphatase 1B [Lingula anatina]|eukprot:XP_013395511.1 protein phosphatase 1B [Lingula anatina]
MGAFLDKPKTEKHNETGVGNGLRFGLSSMQGWRVEMEDAHCAVIGLPGLQDWSFFAVFDGHAGDRVSAYCSEQLLEAIVANEDFQRSEPNLENVKKGIRTGFLNLDEKMRNIPDVINGKDKSGSTAVCSLVSPNHILFANCGDSRGIHCRDGRVWFTTQDHKPVNPTEKERIQKAGGSVMIQRVNGSLAVSRALGDFEYKNVEGMGPCEQLVSPEPEIYVEDRNEKDEFLVLACDGVWDVMSNEDLYEFVKNRMQVTDDLQSICNQVVDTCLYKGSRDNMSIVIVAFQGAPSVSEDAQNREKELDDLLENKVKEILNGLSAKKEERYCDVNYVMNALSEEDIQGLPPGGGLAAKRTAVESILSKYNVNLTSNSDTESC